LLGNSCAIGRERESGGSALPCRSQPCRMSKNSYLRVFTRRSMAHRVGCKAIRGPQSLDPPSPQKVHAIRRAPDFTPFRVMELTATTSSKLKFAGATTVSWKQRSNSNFGIAHRAFLLPPYAMKRPVSLVAVWTWLTCRSTRQKSSHWWISMACSEWARGLRPIQFKRFRHKRDDDGGNRPVGSFRIDFVAKSAAPSLSAIPPTSARAFLCRRTENRSTHTSLGPGDKVCGWLRQNNLGFAPSTFEAAISVYCR
jgi:hypothetical protein